MHFLVTGASGLVGGRTVDYILSLGGHSVLATDIRPRPDDAKPLPTGSQFFQADLTLVQEVDALYDASERPIDGVIHMGAIPNPINIDARLCHNINVTAGYNMMYTAASRGIKRIVQASSVNATGLSYSDSERRAKNFRELEFGLPLKEDETPFLPEDAYSLSKYISEIQSDALCRLFPDLRIASLRFHHVCDEKFAVERSTHRDFWSWTETGSAARACFLGITAEEEGFLRGHEAFFITCDHLNVGNAMKELAWDRGKSEGEVQVYEKLKEVEFDKIGTKDLVEAAYAGVKIKDGWLVQPDDRRGLFDNSKAARLLGWKHDV